MPSVRTVVAWLSLLPLVLAGCAGQPVAPYVPGDAYGVYLFAVAVDCTQMQRVAYGPPGKDPVATRIPAERLTTLEVLVTKADRSACRMRWSAGGNGAVNAASSSGALPSGVTDDDLRGLTGR